MSSTNTSAQPRRLFSGDAALLALAAFWLVFLNGVRLLTLPDEGRYTGVAWDMLRHGDISTPLLNGMPYFHKPPLFYWLDAISMRVFGMNEWAVRLPSVLGAWLALFATYAFVRRNYGVAAARITVLILATMPLFFGAAQFANMDMLVAGLISATVLAGAETILRRDSGRPWRAMSALMGALAGLAFLAKGLIGPVLPGGVLFFWLLTRRDGRGMLALLRPMTLLAFAVVAVPWCVAMQARYPGFFHYFFVYQHFERFLDSGFNNKEPILFYVPVLIATALPWTLWGLGLFRLAFWKAERDPKGIRRLMAIWGLVVLVFFSIPASKLVGYILPALPPLAFLLAERVREAIGRDGAASMRNGRRVSITCVAAVILCLITLVIAAISTWSRSAKPLGEVVRQEARPGDTLVMLHSYAFDLPFYAHYKQPAWVVDNWSDPSIPRTDSWRKELLDASEFDPTVQVLVSDQEWKRRVCTGPVGARYWVWGSEGDQNRYALLAGAKPVASTKRNMLWMLDADATFKQRVCGGTPKAG